jgi:hypothetical protein
MGRKQTIERRRRHTVSLRKRKKDEKTKKNTMERRRRHTLSFLTAVVCFSVHSDVALFESSCRCVCVCVFVCVRARVGCAVYRGAGVCV